MESKVIKLLTGMGIGAFLIGSTAVQAVPVDIVSLDMNMTSLNLDLGNQTHAFSTTNPVSIVMGGYQNPIVTMTDSDGDTVTIYTTAPEPAPSGTADAAAGSLSVDFTSMRADFLLVGGGQGGGGGSSSFTVSLWDGTTIIDTNTYSGIDNAFMLGWTTDVVISGTSGRLRMCAGGRGGQNGAVCDTTSLLEGSVNTVPVPAAVWLFGSGLVGLVGMARQKKQQAAV